MQTIRRFDPPDAPADPFVLPFPVITRMLSGRGWRRVLVMGDSIAAGVGDPSGGYTDTWAERLTAAVAASHGWVAHANLGVPGLRMAEIREQQFDAAVAFRPDLAVVTGGGNDLLATRFDADAVAAELGPVVAALRGLGAEVVTFGLLDLSCTDLLPPESRPALGRRTRALNATTERVTRAHGGRFVDFAAHAGLRAALSADGLHPDRRGQAMIASDVVRVLSTVAVERAA